MGFDIVEILEDLFFVERGYLNANHFVYRGEPPMLIDTGYIADFAETRRAVEGLGVRLESVGALLTTHCHCDHIGGHRLIHQHSGCDILLHEVGKHFIETEDDWSPWWRYYGQQAAFFPCTRGLKDGEIVAVGPHRFEVIHTPGHASDGTVLYSRDHRLLISSDTLWERDMAVHTVRVEGNAAVYWTQRSLEKIADLDVERVCPGHGRIFTDFKGALERAMGRVEDYLTNPRQVGTDVLKKITVYTLLMKQPVDEATFFDLLMGTHWFPETVNLYFGGNYRKQYDETLGAFLKRGVVRRVNGRLTTTVKP
jgi:glyoxylase-like metal-dependent hydrolase (beta-lactamase superfamily II)